jgi:hypothetical protein
MSWLGDLWDTGKMILKKVLGDDEKNISHTTSTIKKTTNTQTIYEPDKIKVAELEAKRMDKAIEAQKEIIQMNNEMQMMIIEAHQKGFEQSTNTLKEMMIALNKIAQERLMLIENGHFEIVEKIERLYLDFEKEIMKDNDNFNMSQLPKMLEMLNKFEPESQSAKLYAKSIDKQIELNISFFEKKLSALHERQKMMVESAIKSKDLILEQSSNIVLDRIKFLEKQLESQNTPQIQNKVDIPKKDDEILVLENKE